MQIDRAARASLTFSVDPNRNEVAADTRNEEHAGTARKVGDGAVLMTEYNTGQLDSRFMQVIQKRFRLRHERVSQQDNCAQAELPCSKSYIEADQVKRKSRFTSFIKKKYHALRNIVRRPKEQFDES